MFWTAVFVLVVLKLAGVIFIPWWVIGLPVVGLIGIAMVASASGPI